MFTECPMCLKPFVMPNFSVFDGEEKFVSYTNCCGREVHIHTKKDNHKFEINVKIPTTKKT